MQGEVIRFNRMAEHPQVKRLVLSGWVASTEALTDTLPGPPGRAVGVGGRYQESLQEAGIAMVRQQGREE